MGEVLLILAARFISLHSDDGAETAGDWLYGITINWSPPKAKNVGADLDIQLVSEPVVVILAIDVDPTVQNLRHTQCSSRQDVSHALLTHTLPGCY